MIEMQDVTKNILIRQLLSVGFRSVSNRVSLSMSLVPLVVENLPSSS